MNKSNKYTFNGAIIGCLINALLNALRQINILKRKYHNKLDGEPMKLGSTEKGTALRNKFDLDICLPFKPGSFSSTEEMYYSVLECLENHVGQNSVVNIRDQKKFSWCYSRNQR